MRLSKFLSVITCITAISLLYVYQQTEILRLAYVGEKSMAVFEDSLDKNSILRYNIGKSTSLAHIGNKVSQSADFQMPNTYKLVRLDQPRGNLGLGAQAFAQENIFARIFGIKRQAEAKTVNP